MSPLRVELPPILKWEGPKEHLVLGRGLWGVLVAWNSTCYANCRQWKEGMNFVQGLRLRVGGVLLNKLWVSIHFIRGL